MNKSNERKSLDSLLKWMPMIDLPSLTNVADGPEPPDFVVQIGNGKIGIEITRSVSQEHAIAKRLQETTCPSSWSNVTNLKDSGTRLPGKEIEKKISAPLRNQAVTAVWQSAQNRRTDLVNAIAKRLVEKRGKFNNPKYPRNDYTENWLVIHVYPVIPARESVAADLMLPFTHILRGPSGFELDFDRIFILSPDKHLFHWHNRQVQHFYKK